MSIFKIQYRGEEYLLNTSHSGHPYRNLPHYRHFDRFGFDMRNPANPPAALSMAAGIALFPNQKERVLAEILRRTSHIEPASRRNRLSQEYKRKADLLSEATTGQVFFPSDNEPEDIRLPSICHDHTASAASVR